MDQLANLAGWAQEHMEALVFYSLAVLAIPFAFGVVFDRVIIRSGFLLIGVFGALAGLFVVLHAQFLAMAQIMIYAVGITLVVVIALMLTNPKLEEDLTPLIARHKIPGFLSAFALFLTIHMAARSEHWMITERIPASQNVETIGRYLMTFYSLPFEFASVLLLAALIGAVMLAKAEPPRTSEPAVAEEEAPFKSSEGTDDVVKV